MNRNHCIKYPTVRPVYDQSSRISYTAGNIAIMEWAGKDCTAALDQAGKRFDDHLTKKSTEKLKICYESVLTIT